VTVDSHFGRGAPSNFGHLDVALRVQLPAAMPRCRTCALLVSLAIVVVSSAASAESLTAGEQELVALINQARVDAGLPPLQADAGLSAVARAHSLDMATTGFFSHSSPTTGEMGERLAAAAVDFRSAGENIAIDSSVEDAHRALVRSAPHRQNMLSPEVTHVGVGIVSNGRSLLVTEVFVRPGPRFVARIPTIEPVVAEATPAESATTAPEADLGVQVGPGPITIVPAGPTSLLPTAEQIPMLQVRQVPMQVPHYPAAGRGYWILGPRGNWIQVRVQPVPLRRRVVPPRTRSLY